MENPTASSNRVIMDATKNPVLFLINDSDPIVERNTPSMVSPTISTDFGAIPDDS